MTRKTRGRIDQFAYGFSATTLPFFQIQIGVPCMLAVSAALLRAMKQGDRGLL